MKFTYAFKGEKKELSINVIFVFLILYMSNSMFMQEAISGKVRFIMTFFVVIILMFIKKFRMSIDKKSIIIFLILMIIQTFSMFIYGVNIEFGIGSIITLVTVFIFTTLISFDQFIISYRYVMFFLCSFSFIAFILYQIMPQLFDIFPQYTWHINTQFKNLFFCVVPHLMQFPRNFGMFVEPGMFQIYINYALIIELFYIKSFNIKYVIIYIVTIITTKSTNGFLVLIILMIAFFSKTKFESKKVKVKYKKILFIFIIFIIFCILLIKNIPYYQYIFMKLIEIGGETSGDLGSGGERWRAFVYALEVYLNFPLYGSGIQLFNNLNSNIIKTFTPLNWFAIYGTIYGVLCNILYLIQVKKIKENILVKILIVVALFLLILSQAMQSNLFSLLLIIYGATLIYEPKTKEIVV